MGIKQSFRLYTLIILLSLLIFTVRNQVMAASGSIVVEPSSGSFVAGSLLNVDVRVDGGGVPFNAAKAQVKIDPLATIQSIQYGDCGFAFVETPTTSNPSFAGVILGGFSQSCTVYTMRFQAVTPGTQLVDISNASIKSYQGAQEELRSIRDGNFSIIQSAAVITPIIGSPVEAPSTDQNGNKLYTVSYSVPVPNNVSTQDVKVLLNSKTVPSRINIAEAQDSNSETLLTAEFENVPEGAHTLSVASGEKTLSEEIVYIDGDNKNVVFGSTPQTSSSFAIWYAVAGVMLIIILGVAGYFGFKWYKRRRDSMITEPPITSS